MLSLVLRCMEMVVVVELFMVLTMAAIIIIIIMDMEAITMKQVFLQLHQF